MIINIIHEMSEWCQMLLSFNQGKPKCVISWIVVCNCSFGRRITVELWLSPKLRPSLRPYCVILTEPGSTKFETPTQPKTQSYIFALFHPLLALRWQFTVRKKKTQICKKMSFENNRPRPKPQTWSSVRTVTVKASPKVKIGQFR